MEAKFKPLDWVSHNGKKAKILSVTKRKAVIYDGKFSINVWLKELKHY